MKTRNMVVAAWGLSLAVCVLALAAWSQVGLEAKDLNAYLLFPLFGLLAFSLMWTHYVVGALRRLAGVDKAPLKAYFRATGWAAIVFILLHKPTGFPAMAGWSRSAAWQLYQLRWPGPKVGGGPGHAQLFAFPELRDQALV